jgi:hypothetical protein
MQSNSDPGTALPVITLYGPSVRPANWKPFYEGVSKTDLSFEIVFVGPLTVTPQDYGLPSNFRYIKTADVKIIQCWQIGASNATAETIILCADDELFSPYGIDKAYQQYLQANDYKAIVGLVPRYGGGDLRNSLRFPQQGGDRVIDLPPGFSVMSKKFFFELGGYDSKFIAGQAELDLFLRAYHAGAKFSYCEGATVDEDVPWGGIQHYATNWNPEDREMLERMWLENNSVRTSPSSPTTVFVMDDTLYKVSQGAKPPNKWV